MNTKPLENIRVNYSIDEYNIQFVFLLVFITLFVLLVFLSPYT